MLLVEDDRTTCELLRAIFGHLGWQVAVASTVAEGLRLLDPPPDLLVLDLTLPDGDGTDILRQVRTAHLPTRVAVTTGHDPSLLPAVASLRPDALLQKPIEVADVCRAWDAPMGPGDAVSSGYG
ncbi:MAG TPA: response regulator [Isosphaeraceae bacterium]